VAALCGRRLLLCVYHHLLFALKRLQQASTHAAINAFIAIRWCIAVYLAGYNICLALQEWAEFVIPLSALNGSLVTPWQMNDCDPTAIAFDVDVVPVMLALIYWLSNNHGFIRCR